LRDDESSGASRFDRKKNCVPSGVHCGAVSFFSLVKVSCRVDEIPPCIDTRYKSVCRFASFQSGVDSVYSNSRRSGLGVGEPTCRICCMSRNVIGRRVVLCARNDGSMTPDDTTSTAIAATRDTAEAETYMDTSRKLGD
jgi:hypothetical protein